MLVGQRLGLLLGESTLGQALDEAVSVERDGFGHARTIGALSVPDKAKYYHAGTLEGDERHVPVDKCFSLATTEERSRLWRVPFTRGLLLIDWGTTVVTAPMCACRAAAVCSSSESCDTAPRSRIGSIAASLVQRPILRGSPA
ncbi:MAG: hypothetical protein OXH52_12325 [Gammaproteobacteria bacterium]|nr:hypothetical protein [Gammaproteobacteria bacterium]